MQFLQQRLQSPPRYVWREVVEVIITLTKKAAPHKVYLCFIAETDRLNASDIPKNIINKAMDTLRVAGLELARI